MKILFLTLAIIINSSSIAQIKFQKNKGWQEIVTKAKLENKYIFVDCFVSWCVPCKQIEKEVFSRQDIGNLYDEHFVSVRVQFDSANANVADLQKWSTTAKRFAEEYKVDAFPCFLFFDTSGQLVAKFSGAVSAAYFLQESRKILDPGNQYYTQLRRYRSGEHSPAFLKKLTLQAARYQDWETVRSLNESFVDLLDTPYVKEQLIAVYAGINSSSNKGFRLLTNNIDKFDSILQDRGRIASVIITHLQHEVYVKFIKDRKMPVRWKKISKYINDKAPGFADRIILSLKLDQAHDNKDWEKFGKLKMDYYDLFASRFDHNQLFFMNNELMEIFRKCSNQQTLLRAATWSKFTLDHVLGVDNAAAMDTYANLLYKAGNITEAIKIQTNAVRLIEKEQPADADAYLLNLQKMKNGIPTWVSSETTTPSTSN